MYRKTAGVLARGSRTPDDHALRRPEDPVVVEAERRPTGRAVQQLDRVPDLAPVARAHGVERRLRVLDAVGGGPLTDPQSQRDRLRLGQEFTPQGLQSADQPASTLELLDG